MNSGMRVAVASLVVSAVAPLAAHAQVTHTISQTGLSFSPTTITIEAGDTVRWVWSGGVHTVTNGTGAADGDAGLIFDQPLTQAVPTFEFLFDTPGEVPFFCRPHEFADMKGTIMIEDAGTSTPPTAEVLRVHGVTPNPFNPQTSVQFSLGTSGNINVHVFDARGRKVRTLAAGVHMDAGDRSINWDGRDDTGAGVSSGVYHLSVRHGEFEQVVRGVLIR